TWGPTCARLWPPRPGDPVRAPVARRRAVLHGGGPAELRAGRVAGRQSCGPAEFTRRPAELARARPHRRFLAAFAARRRCSRLPPAAAPGELEGELPEPAEPDAEAEPSAV